MIALSVVALFEIKFIVENVERELLEVKRQLLSEEENLHVFEAEWAHLNKPERLAYLAKKYLHINTNLESNLIVVENDEINLAKIIQLQMNSGDDEEILKLASGVVVGRDSIQNRRLIGAKKWRFIDDETDQMGKIMSVGLRKRR